MIHHLILIGENQHLRIDAGRLVSGSHKIAVETLGSVQCFSSSCHWSQTALEMLAAQCPAVMAKWDRKLRKWTTFSVLPRCRYVNPGALWNLCRLSPQRSTHLASLILMTKVRNQHQMLRSFNPLLPPHPVLKDNSFNRILRLEAQYARFFWPRYFEGLAQDLFMREKRRPEHPLNASLNYGYGFLYHAIEWQSVACGIDPGIGLVHKLRRSRPSLACDLIEPLRCCVELTVARHFEEMTKPERMGAHFAEMLETKFSHRGRRFRLRSIIRLSIESFVQAIQQRGNFEPFVLDARDACV